jgi:hypothetical protein
VPDIAVINRTRWGLPPFLGLASRASVATISELLISSDNSGYDMEIRLARIPRSRSRRTILPSGGHPCLPDGERERAGDDISGGVRVGFQVNGGVGMGSGGL